MEQPPVINSNSKERSSDSFQPNGTEIGNLQWISIKDLTTKDGLLYFGNKSVRPSYTPILNKIIRYMRDKELNKKSNGIINSHNNLVELTKYFKVNNILPQQLSGEFNEDSYINHNKEVCVAKQLGKLTNSNTQTLAEIIGECKNT